MNNTRLFLRAGVFVIAVAGLLRMNPVAAQFSPMSQEGQAFGDFTQLVKDYAQLRKAAPNQRTTDQRKEIVNRRQALAAAIRTARSNAKQGDVFTPQISEQFKKVIQRTLQGTQGANARKTIRQGDPVVGVQLTINGSYPEDLPVTSIPPSLLRRLPELPDRVAYRIVGHDFVLQDTEARLIIDLIPGALP